MGLFRKILNINTIITRSVAQHRNQDHCIAPNRFKGKIAVLTASTEGIGLGIAKRLSQEGARVIISSRSGENVDTAVHKLRSEGLDVSGVVCHVSKKDERTRLFEKAQELGGLDILVSNAGVNPIQVPLTQLEEEGWNKIFDVNVTASFLLAKEAYPLLKERGGGSITFLSSVISMVPLDFNIGAYATSKTALLGLTKMYATELAEDNIRVNCVAPGIIDTRFGDYIQHNEQFYKATLDSILIKRSGTPEDISGVVAFLASDDAQYITGEIIVAAGGIHARI